MGQYVEVETGVNVFVEDVGQGQPVIFLHGWPLNHKAFEMQMNEIPKHGYRFIGIDLRGYGKSDRPWSGYDYDTAAGDVRAVIDHLGLSNFVLAGFSMGGPIAIRYMTKFNGHGVDKLLLLSAAAPIFTQRDDFKYGMKPKEVDEIVEQIEQDRPAFMAQFSKMFFEQKKSTEFLSWFQRLGLEAGGHATIQSAKALRDEDLRGELERISVPTAIFHGKKDQICQYELGEEMQQRIPGARIVTFDKSGHGINGDEPEKFNEELLRFLAEPTR